LVTVGPSRRADDNHSTLAAFSEARQAGEMKINAAVREKHPALPGLHPKQSMHGRGHVGIYSIYGWYGHETL